MCKLARFIEKSVRREEERGEEIKRREEGSKAWIFLLLLS
jgi:hypothetical protein